MKSILYLFALLTMCQAVRCANRQTPRPVDSNRFTVACYYFPNYHPGDPRNEKRKGGGWSEWDLVRKAVPRFPGHQQPNVPLWGYEDESDPRVMARKIDAAADHNIDAFIFDWYYYDDGPFLDRCLNRGFLQAGNRRRMKFALMWANHDWVDIMPLRKGTIAPLLYPGRITPATFETMVQHLIADYFLQPGYWLIDGKPYFSIYELTRLLESFGSVQATRKALDEFRRRVQAAGLPGLHLNAVVWGQPILPGENAPVDPWQLVKELGFDSITSYVWVHHVSLPQRQTPYPFVRDRYLAYWQKSIGRTSLPYFPNVSMGWDPSPRTVDDGEYGDFGYPFTNTISENTPEQFKEALRLTRDRLAGDRSQPRIITINAWNEWTESSYLEPDLKNGTRYLQAIREVFQRPEER